MEGFLNNSEFVRDQLQNMCLGGHRHVATVGGRARACQEYPEKLCRAMTKGIRMELVHSGIINGNDEDMLMVSAEDANSTEYLDECVDDVTEKPLIRELIMKARKDEMNKFSLHNVYAKRHRPERVHKTGEPPIGCKWIDINKGDVKNPNYRSRRVAKEIKGGPSDDMSAATPPPWP